MIEELEERVSHIKQSMSVSIIGCVVNGPGEARETQIGLTGGGNGNHLLYIGGNPDRKVKTEEMIDRMVELIEEKAEELAREQHNQAA